MSSKEEKLKTLVQMGFDEDKASKTLEMFPDSIELAVEHLSKGDNGQNEVKTAKSYICTDTGKTFRTLEAAQAYAARTGNSNFEERDIEIPPLTEEEKKRKIAELKERMKARREEREAEEKISNVAQEITRRKEGKNMAEIREKMQKQKRLNDIELRKREKREEEEVRQKLREEIAKDKGNRAAEKARKEGLDPNKAYKEAYENYLKKVDPSKKEKTIEERIDQVISAIEVLDNKTIVLQTLVKMVTNIVNQPENEKFRKIKLSNPAFQKRVGRHRSGIVFLKTIGFHQIEEDNLKFLILTNNDVNLDTLNLALNKLSTALGV